MESQIISFYNSKVCTHEQNEFKAVELSDYSKLIEKLAKQLYDGALKPTDLSPELLQKTLGDLRSATAEGVGDSFIDYEDKAKRNLALNKNLYRFSAAKTYQQLALVNFHLKDSKSFADFKEKALKVNSLYNINYLEAEYISANRSGAMAEKWDKYTIQKDLYPNLRYKTVKDNRVREEHRNLEDIIKPINDPFWDTWYPPNGWRCRCYVTQTDDEATAGTPEGNPTPGFHGNVGKSNFIFNENEHPYFVFPDADVLKIQKSFNAMKISTPDYQTVFETKKAKLEVSTWADLADVEQNIITAKILVDKLGISVKIRPHTETSKVKNPEYLINGVIGDRVGRDTAPLRKYISNTFSDKLGEEKQLRENVACCLVLDFKTDFLGNDEIQQIASQLWSKFNNYKTVSELYLINGDKAVVINRAIIKKGYGNFKGEVAGLKNDKSKE